jgi:hypothetical protein
VFALPVIFAITGHEAAHAYAARHFGDNTAYLEGRMTLNPLRRLVAGDGKNHRQGEHRDFLNKVEFVHASPDSE